MRYLLFLFIFISVSAPAHALGALVSSLEQEYQLRSPLQPVGEVRLAENSKEENSEEEDEDFITPNQKRKIKGFWEKYFAFQPNKNLVKEVRENKWAFFAGGCMSCVGGTVWLPTLVIDEKPPEGYFQESLINWGAHFVFEWVNNGITFALGSVSIPSPTALLSCADMVWWLPVNAMNLWDDARKRSLAQKQIQKDYIAKLKTNTDSSRRGMVY